MLVTPSLSRICIISSSMTLSITGSSPDVGSSYSKISGDIAIARASPTRFAIPPDSDDGYNILSVPGRPTSSQLLGDYSF